MADPDGRRRSHSGRLRDAAVWGILSAEQIRRLNDLTPATGERHDEASMSTVDC